MDRRLCGPQSRSERGEEEKNFLLLPGAEPPPCSPSLCRHLSRSIWNPFSGFGNDVPEVCAGYRPVAEPRNWKLRNWFYIHLPPESCLLQFCFLSLFIYRDYIVLGRDFIYFDWEVPVFRKNLLPSLSRYTFGILWHEGWNQNSWTKRRVHNGTVNTSSRQQMHKEQYRNCWVIDRQRGVFYADRAKAI
jgi:hypothetical protein